MSKTGGGRGTNQYRVKGTDKAKRATGSSPRFPTSNDEMHATPTGATPVDEDYREFFVDGCKWVNTLEELNRVESANITAATVWLALHPFEAASNLLTQASLRELHCRMFCDVWTWAGRIRVRETSLGVDPSLIVESFENVLRDAKTQIQQVTFPPEEIAIRFHWQLVRIHPFANGNGRHARLATNELARVINLGESYFSWGRRSGQPSEAVRAAYLAALRVADANGDLEPLRRIATA
jgi:Fic-DOC domain mobile mystery protein B